MSAFKSFDLFSISLIIGRNAEDSMKAIAEGVAEAVPAIINAIRNDAEVTVTDVVAGSETATGGID